ncbi:hypothetical protein CTAM01_03685 [Colletotrichum tamarilloi]|uniref:Uncharacterized protein n=1 Tax=Colletotrichum tamarilloi TaxID=1209934 RepID=A0ABQ9RKH5_9PEZI|nr:uncharacterized protein CTAM01_03685 [Colletotrichum tamarilloi]KAK1506350.1 hypothetical protein CTAM01_03685 [Colletotrichum tamarilloi]
MQLTYAILLLGIGQHALGHHLEARKENSCSGIKIPEDCKPSSGEAWTWLTMSQCVLKTFTIDKLIDCIGDNDANICERLPEYRTDDEVLFDGLDGKNDGKFCIKPRGILWLAARAARQAGAPCNLDRIFYCCPDGNVAGFRSCLCSHSVTDEKLTCMSDALGLLRSKVFNGKCEEGIRDRDVNVKKRIPQPMPAKDTKILPWKDNLIVKLGEQYICSTFDRGN